MDKDGSIFNELVTALQEADVNCKQYSVCVEGCLRLASLEFGAGCLAAIKHVDISCGDE